MKLLLDKPNGKPALLVVTTKESRTGGVNVRLAVPKVTLRKGGQTATGEAQLAQFKLGMN